MLFALFIDPLVLMVTLWAVARHNAEYSYPTLLLISIGLAIVGIVLSFLIGLFAVIPLFGLMLWVLMRFCYVTLTQALIVTAIFIAFKIALAIVLSL
jgi:hypothetical protein